MKKLVVITGAGVSAESGLPTFRDSGGLWDKYDPMEVCSVPGWRKDRAKVLEFYNLRRAELERVQPNHAHMAISMLERVFDVHIITTNVDDLHERAGSSKVLHLHGELLKACSSNRKESGIIDYPASGINIGDKHSDGSQLRPYIVWFGEDVPKMKEAETIVDNADVIVVIGTSLNVYPAADLVLGYRGEAPIININPEQYVMPAYLNVRHIGKSAVEGMSEAVVLLFKFLNEGEV